MTRCVRSLREGDFALYVQACDKLCGWFHALDHTNYARWLPVHVRDMVVLADKHPTVHAEFMKGNFVVQKSARKFSLMAKDQAHEQSKEHMKASKSMVVQWDYMRTQKPLHSSSCWTGLCKDSS